MILLTYLLYYLYKIKDSIKLFEDSISRVKESYLPLIKKLMSTWNKLLSQQ